MWISERLDGKRFLKSLYIIIAVSYLLYTFLPVSLQFVIIIMSKVTTDFIWIIMGMYMIRVFPTHFISLITACKNSYSLIVSTTLPYIKFLTEKIGLSVFPIAGVYYIGGGICGELIKPLKK